MNAGKDLALLIPGLDGTGRLYYRQIEPLSKRYRVNAWEFRRRHSFDLSDLVDEIAQGTENEPPESMLVVGESFGGLIALQFALRYAGRTRHLVLINSFPQYRLRMRIRIGCRLAGFLARPLAKQIKDFVVERTLKAEGIPAEERRLYRETIRRVYHPAYCRRLELVRDVDLRGQLDEIKVPTLLFASGRDKIVRSISEARYMHSVIPNSKIYEFPRAGHALLLTPGFILADFLGV